jgi:hypothetical protein
MVGFKEVASLLHTSFDVLLSFIFVTGNPHAHNLISPVLLFVPYICVYHNIVPLASSHDISTILTQRGSVASTVNHKGYILQNPLTGVRLAVRVVLTAGLHLVKSSTGVRLAYCQCAWKNLNYFYLDARDGAPL